MKKTGRRPFQNLGMEAWQNLAMVALFVVYLFQLGSSLQYEAPLGTRVGADFRAFWSAGVIANTYGYGDVYDLDRLAEVQEKLPPADPANPSVVIPAPYPPVFIPLFQCFAFFPPVASFYLWSIVNLAGLFLYLQFFFRKLGVPGWLRLTILGVLAFPSFQNLFWGQINILLLISAGEFTRHAMGKRDIPAGLWLGGLLLKPQVLILIGPFLLFQRKWKMLGGFSIAAIFALVASILMVKVSGVEKMIALLTQYFPSFTFNAQANMMNWRMIAERLSAFLPSDISWIIAVVGTVITLIPTFLLWRKPLPSSSPEFLIAFTGTLAATLAVTWHAHIHMAMVLIPPLLYLVARQDFPIRIFNWWIFGVPFIVLLLAFPVKLLGLDRYNALQGLTGLCMLVFNLIFLAWAWNAIRLKSKRTLPA